MTFAERDRRNKIFKKNLILKAVKCNDVHCITNGD